jgi:hypothetical protein
LDLVTPVFLDLVTPVFLDLVTEKRRCGEKTEKSEN